MLEVKQEACSKAAVQLHQTFWCPDEFWTTVWRMLWRQTSGDGDWLQTPTCTRLRDTTGCSRVATWTSVLAVWSPHGVGQAASAIPADQSSDNFCHAMLCISAACAVVVCPLSVRPSVCHVRVCIKRLMLQLTLAMTDVLPLPDSPPRTSGLLRLGTTCSSGAGSRWRRRCCCCCCGSLT